MCLLAEVASEDDDTVDVSHMIQTDSSQAVHLQGDSDQATASHVLVGRSGI